ncbi:MAG: hypothetical protein RR413_11410, partial [Christensenellaceae bacterium]
TVFEVYQAAAHHLWRDAHKLQVKSGDKEMMHKLEQGQPIRFSDANRLGDAIRTMLRAKKERRLEIARSKEKSCF